MEMQSGNIAHGSARWRRGLDMNKFLKKVDITLSFMVK